VPNCTLWAGSEEFGVDLIVLLLKLRDINEQFVWGRFTGKRAYCHLHISFLEADDGRPFTNPQSAIRNQTDL